MLHRPTEAALKQVSGKLLLRPLAWPRGLIHMGALRVVPFQESLLCHDLHELQNCAVLNRLTPPPDRFVNFTHSTRLSEAPENCENLQFGIRGLCRFVRHVGKIYYEIFLMSNTKHQSALLELMGEMGPKMKKGLRQGALERNDLNGSYTLNAFLRRATKPSRPRPPSRLA